MLSIVRDREGPAPRVSRDGERAVVWLVGEQDIATVNELSDTLANVVSADAADLIVDLSGMTFMSAATIGEFIRTRDTLQGQNRHMALRSPSRFAGRLLDLCGLTGLVELERAR